METAGDPGDVQARQCGTCDGASASCWCVDCSEALCDACLAAHRRVTLTRSHRVLNRQPEGPSLVFPTKFCRIHPSEELKLFCFSCCQLTCRDCQLADHQNHRFDFVSKAVASVKKQLDACMQPFRAQMDASRRSLQDMETRLQVLAHCESFMTSKLQKHVDTLMELLKKRFEEIIKQIQVVYNVERNQISRKMEKVKQLQQNHVPLTEAAEKARSTTNLPTLVGCISQITSQMKDLVDEDSRPPSKMLDVKVITDRSSVEGILNFGKLHVSWIPFSAPPSSSSLLPAPPTSTCRPLTCSTASTNSSSVAAPPPGCTSTFIRTRPFSGSGTAASSAPSVRISCSTPPPYSSSSYPSSSGDAMTDFIENNKAVLHPKSSSISKLDPSCGSWGPAQIPRVPSSNNSLPASTSLSVSGSTSLPVSVFTSLPVSGPTSLPVSVFTSLPVSGPTSLPVSVFTSLPVSGSTPFPVSVFASLPVSGLTSLPVPASTSLPVSGLTSLPVPASASFPLPASTSLPVSGLTSLPVPASASFPLPASTSLPVPASTSLPVPASTSLPVSGPTSLPVSGPTSLPVSGPTSLPVSGPTSLPVSGSTPFPVSVFASLPVSGLTSLPVPASASFPLPACTSLPVSGLTSLPVPASASFPLPSSTSLPLSGLTSLPVPASTSLPVPAVVKSKAAQYIEARNPFLWSLLSQSSSSSSSPVSPSPPSSGPVRGQSSSSSSSSSLTSDVRLQTSTTKGSERVEGRSEGAKPTGKRNMEPSRGFDSAVRINVLTKSQLESSSEKLFVKFQWMKKNSKSSKSSSSLVPGSPKIKRLLSGKRPQKIQNQPGSPVQKLNRQAGGMESSPSMPSVPPFPSTNLVFPKAVSTAALPTNIQPLVPDTSNVPVQPSPSLNQQVLGQNPPTMLLLTNTSQTPVTGFGSGSLSSVPTGPQTPPGNDPSVRWSPEIQNLPESNNLQLLECLISEVGLPSSALKDQQQNPASKQRGKRNRLVQGSSPLECRSSDPTRTGASDQDLIVVLSDDESLPDVYEVQPSVEEVQSFLPPVTVGGSDAEVGIVDTKPPGDESKPRTFKFIEREIFDEAASPAVSEDRMSTALSEVPELGLKLSSSDTSDSDDEDLLSIRTEQPDYGQLCWQPTVSLLRLPLSLPGPGRHLPRYHFILGDKQDELYLQEMEEDDQSSGEDVSEIVSDHDSDVTEDFTILHSTESPLSLEVISCAACGSSSASKICTICGRGYHRDCHVPPFGPDIWSELVCSLCQDLSDPSDPYSSDRPKSPHGSSLSLQDQRRCESLLLHLKVESCRHFSQLDLWSDLMLVSERLSHHLSPPYQTPAQVVSDLWDLFSDASQGNALLELQQSFQKRLVETLGSELPPSLLMAPPGSAPPPPPPGPLDSGENLLSDSQVKVLKKRLKDLMDLNGPAAAKRPRSINPEDQTDQM